MRDKWPAIDVRRYAVFALVLIAHALIFSTLFRSSAHLVDRTRGDPALTIVQIAAPAPPRPIPRPPALRPIIDERRPILVQQLSMAITIPVLEPLPPIDSDPTTAEIAADIAQGKPCPAVDMIQRALVEAPTVAPALAHIPLAARSVANAVMVWNGGWADAAQIGGPSAIEPLITVIVGRLARLPDACLDMDLNGPRLFLVSDRDTVVALVIGSGKWRWRDVWMTAQMHGFAGKNES